MVRAIRSVGGSSSVNKPRLAAACRRAFLPLSLLVLLNPAFAADPPTAPAPKPAAPAASPAAAPAAAKPAAPKPAAPKPAAAKPATPAAKPAPAPKGPIAGSLVWRGDIASARGLMNDIAKQYEREKRIRIEINPFSTISGIDAVAGGTADLAGSLRPAHGKRTEETGLTFVPVAWDGLVMITSPTNPVASISVKDIWRVYYGRADNWKLLGGKDQAINMYAVAGPLDGVEYSLRAMIFKNGDQRVAVPRLYINTAKLEEGVTLDPAALGVSTLSSTAGNPKLKILNVEGVVPSMASVGNGSYPLYTPVYVALREDAANAAKVKEFIAWLDTPPAHETLRKHQLVPYSAGTELAANDATRLAMIETKVNETPIAAPAATAAALSRVAPTSPATQAAKESAAESREVKAEAKKAAAKAPKSAPKAEAKAEATGGK
jgi:phosphate transport system substrate-binding protein